VNIFHYDARTQSLMGADTGLTIGLGQRVTVRLAEAVPVTGGLVLELLAVEGAQMPSPVRRARGRGAGPRKPGLARRKDEKTKRKVTRRRK
jgi:ribonuclease R